MNRQLTLQTSRPKLEANRTLHNWEGQVQGHWGVSPSWEPSRHYWLHFGTLLYEHKLQSNILLRSHTVKIIFLRLKNKISFKNFFLNDRSDGDGNPTKILLDLMFLDFKFSKKTILLLIDILHFKVARMMPFPDMKRDIFFLIF